jgi:hypothetical protein
MTLFVQVVGRIDSTVIMWTEVHISSGGKDHTLCRAACLLVKGMGIKVLLGRIFDAFAAEPRSYGCI